MRYPQRIAIITLAAGCAITTLTAPPLHAETHTQNEATPGPAPSRCETKPTTQKEMFAAVNTAKKNTPINGPIHLTQHGNPMAVFYAWDSLGISTQGRPANLQDTMEIRIDNNGNIETAFVSPWPKRNGDIETTGINETLIGDQAWSETWSSIDDTITSTDQSTYIGKDTQERRQRINTYTLKPIIDETTEAAKPTKSNQINGARTFHTQNCPPQTPDQLASTTWTVQYQASRKYQFRFEGTNKKDLTGKFTYSIRIENNLITGITSTYTPRNRQPQTLGHANITYTNITPITPPQWAKQ